LALASIDGPGSGRLADLARHVSGLLDSWPDGRIKFFVSACGMRLRRARPALFIDGSYDPLVVAGRYAAHLVAFGRRLGPDLLIAIVPRLTRALCTASRAFPLGDGAWEDTRVLLPPPYSGRGFRDLLTGARAGSPPGADGLEGGTAQWLVGDVLKACPVALLWADFN
jgi:(1->4)-alpha-D-glucan 1-alpha-D-glucosylmutase